MPEAAAAVIDAPYRNELMSGLRAVLIGSDSSDPKAAWQVMRLAKGQANPQVIQQELNRQLEERRK